MNRRWQWQWLWLWLLGLYGLSAWIGAEPVPSVPAPLTREAVLDSVAIHYPKIQAALAKQVQAEGKYLAAQGEFDPKFKQESLFWAAGYYDLRTVDNKVVKPLGPLAAEVFAGYRVAAGAFPVYYDRLETLSGGEFNFGLVFSLLRDRVIDPRRFKRQQAQWDLIGADYDLLATRLGVHHRAIKAYWYWLATGLKLAIYRELLVLSEWQRVALEKRLQAGQIASILLVENQQYVLKRRATVLEAKQDFTAAGIALSLYLRDAKGLPLVPDLQRLPRNFPAFAPDMVLTVADDQASMREQHPDLAALRLAQAKTEGERQLARNNLLPRLDVTLKAARDIGTGKESRHGNDVIVELAVEVPLGQRKARGEIAAAVARRQALADEQRLLAQQLEADIARLAELIRTERDMIALLQQEVAQAMALRAAEEVRFKEGASDYFLLNAREERTAESRVRLIDAWYRYYTALADYQAATVDIEALALDQPALGLDQP